MSATRARIENLIVRIQSDFLETPWLALKVSNAQERFGVSRIACEAALDFLADARVVSRSRQGIYVRHFPQATARRRRSMPLRAA